MTDIEIRYATKEDCEILSKVIERVIENIPYYNDLAKRDEILKFQPQDLEKKIANDKFSAIVAITDKSIVGFCLTRFDDYLIWLEWVGVAENYRGKGVANLLLKELDKTTLPRNCHKTWCDCRTLNKAAIHILTHNGYRQLVTIRNHWYNQDFILWEKPA